jgi:hypothetical protein
LGWALITRLALLASITWTIGLTQPLVELFGQLVSWRDMVLVAGGLFLLYKSAREIYHALEGAEPEAEASARAPGELCRRGPQGTCRDSLRSANRAPRMAAEASGVALAKNGTPGIRG